MAEGVNPLWLAAVPIAGLAGVVAGAWWASRRRGMAWTSDPVTGFTADLLPEPALEWLRRSHAAHGAWATEPGLGPNEVRLLRAVDAQLDADEARFLENRLARAREREQSGTERLDSGLFVYRGAGETATALFLPHDATDDQRRAADADLVLLLDLLRRREISLGLGTSTSGTHAAVLESVESVGRRMALQLMRLTGGAAVVATRELRQVRIVGVSANADARLEGKAVPAGSPLARVATGTLEAHLPDTDAIGIELVGDRRQPRTQPMLFPVAVGNTVVGAVAIYPLGQDGLSPSMLGEVRVALSSAAARLGRATEAYRLKREAFHDTLTGLLNRRGLEQEMSRIGVSAGALVACDFDEFKKLNDTLGHPAGDAALAHFARIMEEQVRGEDRVARVGGEEFLIWLPNASLTLGVRVAERIRVKLGTTAWAWQGRAWPLRASFGVSACPESCRRVESLAAQADAALYVAKRSGRNRVEAAGAMVGDG
jgi:diguanylate cyclase (GGDEF)-like protein